MKKWVNQFHKSKARFAEMKRRNKKNEIPVYFHGTSFCYSYLKVQ